MQPEQPSAGGRWSNLETKLGEMGRKWKEYINRWRKKTACLGGFQLKFDFNIFQFESLFGGRISMDIMMSSNLGKMEIDID